MCLIKGRGWQTSNDLLVSGIGVKIPSHRLLKSVNIHKHTTRVLCVAESDLIAFSVSANSHDVIRELDKCGLVSRDT